MTMIDSDNNTTEPTADAVLRKLALRANGMTGADIERLVREARQKARRQHRGLRLSDMLEILTVAKPVKPEAVRWRQAVHEAGHALADVALGLGPIIAISIDGPGGSAYVESEMPRPMVESEAFAEDLLVSKLAGRAAEKIVFGFVTAGSGGVPGSDLATATDLATSMETTMGFGSEWPLLYRQTDDHAALLIYNPLIAERVSARLEAAYGRASELISMNREALETLAKAIVKYETLEGEALEAVLLVARNALNGTLGACNPTGQKAFATLKNRKINPCVQKNSKGILLPEMDISEISKSKLIPPGILVCGSNGDSPQDSILANPR